MNANTNVIGIISNANKGYTASVNALASLYPTSKVLDYTDEGLVEAVVSTTGRLDVVSCADFGLNSFIALLGNEEIAVTVEQMNFLSEFLNLGGDFPDVTVSYWQLSSASNAETYQSVMAKAEAGEAILDARAAWQRELEK